MSNTNKHKAKGKFNRKQITEIPTDFYYICLIDQIMI